MPEISEPCYINNIPSIIESNIINIINIDYIILPTAAAFPALILPEAILSGAVAIMPDQSDMQTNSGAGG